jgi:hypothetical protein
MVKTEQALQSLLQSFAGLFVEPCIACQRVLSAECHIPPVARVWSWTTEPPKDIFSNASLDFQPIAEEHIGGRPAEEKLGEGESSRLGQWETWHVTCLRA